MNIKVQGNYPHSGGQYFDVTYYSNQFINRDLAELHKERLEKFLKKEQIRVKKETEKFKKMMRK